MKHPTPRADRLRELREARYERGLAKGQAMQRMAKAKPQTVSKRQTRGKR